MGIPTWVAFGAVDHAGASAALTPTMPAGTSADDILILVVESDHNQAVTLSTANGFAETASSPQDAVTGGSTRITTFWKRAVGSDSAPVIAAATDHLTATVLAVRGCKTSGNPWNTSAGGVKSSAGTTFSAPGATTNADDCLIVLCITDHLDQTNTRYSGWTNADLGSITERVDGGTTDGNGGGIGIATGTLVTQGTFGATTGTMGASAYNAYVTLALEGASASVSVTATVAAATSQIPSSGGRAEVDINLTYTVT